MDVGNHNGSSNNKKAFDHLIRYIIVKKRNNNFLTLQLLRNINGFFAVALRCSTQYKIYNYYPWNALKFLEINTAFIGH